eukprot:sb/3472653/
MSKFLRYRWKTAIASPRHEASFRDNSSLYQEPTETSKQPIITRYLGHVTGHQGPIRYQYFLIQLVPALYLLRTSFISQTYGFGGGDGGDWSWNPRQGPTETSKQPIRTSYLGRKTIYNGQHVTHNTNIWLKRDTQHHIWATRDKITYLWRKCWSLIGLCPVT